MRSPWMRLVLVIGVIGIVLWFATKPRQLGSWQQLPSGGWIRVLHAQVGSTEVIPQLPDRGGSLVEIWLDTLSRPKPVLKTPRSPGAHIGMSIWMEWQGNLSRSFPRDLRAIPDLEIALPDGQILLTRSGVDKLDVTPNEGVWKLGRFPVVPWREKVLNITFTLDGKRYKIRTSNPGYRIDAPTWNPEPLPQSWKDGDLAITLKALNLKWNERDFSRGVRWELQPDWDIRLKGQPAETLFRISSLVEDSGGNRWRNAGLLGEPAWKLNCTVRRREDYPFAKDEVRWLGRFDPAAINELGEGEYQAHPEGDSLMVEGIYFSGVVTRGEYEIVNGKVTTAKKLALDNPTEFFSAGAWPRTKRLHASAHKPVYFQYLKPPPEGEFYVWQFEDDGRTVNEDYFGLYGTNGDLIKWAPLPTKPFRFGIAKQRTFKFESFVKPPKAPARPKS